MASATDESMSENLQVSMDKSPCQATLLLIVGEPFTIEQKDLILERIVTELFSWDTETAKCDIDEQLGKFAKQQPRGRDGTNGEKIFELKSEVLRVDVLLNPRLRTVQDKIHSFLLNPSHYRHLLYSGLAFHGTGCWILQDGVFSFSSLLQIFQKPDVLEALSHQTDAVLDVSVFSEGNDWTESGLKKVVPGLKLRLNPAKSQRNEDGIIQFSDILSLSLKAPSCVELLQATEIVGNISFQRPTIYIFPAGRGDSALFGIGGFNLLVNGGYSRRSCFWQCVRHLLRIDATIISHISPDNIFGISAFLERKALEKTSPDLGVVYLNIGDTKPIAPNGSLPVSSGLLVSLADEGIGLVDHLHHIGMAVNPCAGSLSGQTIQPVNLYFKVGHGSLDLYILNPLNGKELKDFLSSWAKNISSRKLGIPAADEQSVCSLLVWRPSSTKEKPVRILFPGNAPQSKIFEGLERLKSVYLFQTMSGHPEKVPSTKVQDKRPVSSMGKVPVAKSSVPSLAAEAESKKAPLGTSEQKSAGDHKEVKKTTDHREIKKPVDHKMSAKSETEVKKSAADGKHGGENRELKKTSNVEVKDSKRMSSATAEHKDAKVANVKQDSTPGKQAKVPEKAAKDATNKKVAKETQEIPKTQNKKAAVGKGGRPSLPAPGKADKNQKKEPGPIKRPAVPTDVKQDENKPPSSEKEPQLIPMEEKVLEGVAVSVTENETMPELEHESAALPVIEKDEGGLTDELEQFVKQTEVEALPEPNLLMDKVTMEGVGLLGSEHHVQTSEKAESSIISGGEDGDGNSESAATEELLQSTDRLTPESVEMPEKEVEKHLPEDAVLTEEEEEETAELPKGDGPLESEDHSASAGHDFEERLEEESGAMLEDHSASTGHDFEERLEEESGAMLEDHSALTGHDFEEGHMEECRRAMIEEYAEIEGLSTEILETMQIQEKSEPTDELIELKLPETVMIVQNDDDLGESVEKELFEKPEKKMKSENTEHIGSVTETPEPDEDEDQENEDLVPEEDEDQLINIAKEVGDQSAIKEKAVDHGHDEVPFDPQREWGQPEGLPAPVNGKDVGSGKKGDQSVLNASVAGARRSAPAVRGPSGAQGKKADGKEAAAKAKRPVTATDDSVVAEDAAKATTARVASSSGAIKRVSNVTARSTDQQPIKDSVSKSSHQAEAKRSASKPVVPFFVDLTYIPSHGDLRHFDVDFFRAVRARYYVLSSTEPDTRVLSLLLDGKQSWENGSEEVTIIPTYDTESLTSWASVNQDRLKQSNVVMAPSASQCTMLLQEHGASCPAFRLEF